MSRVPGHSFGGAVISVMKVLATTRVTLASAICCLERLLGGLRRMHPFNIYGFIGHVWLPALENRWDLLPLAE